MSVCTHLAQSDARGFVFVMEFDDKDYLLIFTKVGLLRGGEIHKGKQFNVLLQGTIVWNIDGDERTYHAPAYIVTPKETPHMMESSTDSLILEWREYPLENPVNYYKPFRDIILRRREK